MKHPSSRGGWSDARLVAACLLGDEAAWNELVERYEKLVLGIIASYGAGANEAADLFQSVWLDVHHGLDQLRKPEAFEPWLVSVISRVCYHWRRQQDRQDAHEIPGIESLPPGAFPVLAPEFRDRLERSQTVRSAVRDLPPRCRRMIQLLFFTEPPRPYAEVAAELGLATGSIGFIRGRCLDRLRDNLEKLGLP